MYTSTLYQSISAYNSPQNSMIAYNSPQNAIITRTSILSDIIDILFSLCVTGKNRSHSWERKIPQDTQFWKFDSELLDKLSGTVDCLINLLFMTSQPPPLVITAMSQLLSITLNAINLNKFILKCIIIMLLQEK